MSIVAEFASKLYSQRRDQLVRRELDPIHFPRKTEKLSDMRAVIFDVYGTLIDYWKPGYGEAETRQRMILESFCETINYFGFRPSLLSMNPAEPPEKTLQDLYHGLISLDHEKSRRKKIETPEIRIERIWQIILMMLKRHGYSSDDLERDGLDDYARCVAYYYNTQALGGGLFAGALDACRRLHEGNLKLGIVSNAQFYTPIDLTLSIRDESNGDFDAYTELFDTDLVFYSFEYGVAKPGNLLFEKLFNALYEMQILPAQTLFVGNDLSLDIKTAQDLGLMTALFCGSRESTFLHDLADRVVPDIAFADFAQLPDMVSFHGAGNRED